LTSAGAGLIKCFLLASPSKFSFSFSKFPEGGLILAIVVLGLLLAVFGGSVSRPKFEKNAEGKQERVYETDADGKKSPAFATVNKFFNLPTLIQIAKDTSFFAIMAVGMTFVIITGALIFRLAQPVRSLRRVERWFCPSLELKAEPGRCYWDSW
jgi:hypothetical protein